MSSLNHQAVKLIVYKEDEDINKAQMFRPFHSPVSKGGYSESVRAWQKSSTQIYQYVRQQA